MKPAMFQLVFQFDCESMEAFDAIAHVEEQLISLLGESAEVDGHDIGSAKANIFIHTLQPMESFKTCHAFLQGKSPRIATTERRIVRLLAAHTQCCIRKAQRDSGSREARDA